MYGWQTHLGHLTSGGTMANFEALWVARELRPGTAIAASAQAQITTGTVTGRVLDAGGGVIPGATVILISETRGTKSAPVTTNATGDYVFPGITADRKYLSHP
jgi:hypothetical protein